MARLVVRGAGDVGSAVAWRLRAAGHAIVLHDRARPSHHRRGMAFTDAYFEGVCTLEGVLAKRASTTASLGRMLSCGHALPVSDADFEEVLGALEPDGIVDARMRKHDVPESRRGHTRLAIGLGPGFLAGENADIVIETAWGDALGAIIRDGRASDYSGEPRPLGGMSRERYARAPVDGIFETTSAIGGLVHEGEPVARVGDQPILAPLAGILRGLTHDGAIVSRGAKIVEVDPRGDPSAAFGIGERPGRIAEGVVAAVEDALRHH